MATKLGQTILQFTFSVFLATGIAVAQDPAEEMLPNAHVAMPPEAPVAPVEKETRQLRPEFTTGMSAKDKYALAYRRIVSPQMPIKAAFVSGWEVGTGTGPDLPTNGWGPFAERVGYNAASISTTIFFTTAFVPTLFHQDPRYFPLGSGPAKARLVWAVRSEFVGFGDDGHAMPNYANMVGLALSSIAVNAFSPRGSVGYGDTVERYAIKIGVGTGLNVVREFHVFDRVRAFARHSKSADDQVTNLMP
jgi:hypothetical protein